MTCTIQTPRVAAVLHRLATEMHATKELFLAVSPDTARLLYLLGRALGARAL